jgi:hypothetical protein
MQRLSVGISLARQIVAAEEAARHQHVERLDPFNQVFTCIKPGTVSVSMVRP